MDLELTNKEKETVRLISEYFNTNGEMPSVRTLMSLLNYKSPRSVSVILESLDDKNVIYKKLNGKYYLSELKIIKEEKSNAQTIKVPLLGSISCGAPIYAEENIEAEISISLDLLNQNNKYFLLRAEGDSMDLDGISNGDIVLVKQQNHAEIGDKVVALIDDHATIKLYHRANNMVILKPKSSNKEHQPIILTSDFRIQGVVETVIPI